MTHLSRQRKRNLKEIPIVAASEVGRAQTKNSILGVVGPVIKCTKILAERMGRWATQGDSPVCERELSDEIGT